jgi:penicillin amidase
VGWQLAGTTPRRKKGHGLLPQAGWDPEAGWHEQPVPFEELPSFRCQAPNRDLVASANNPPRPEGDGPFLGQDWMDAYRHRSILEALSARRDWDVASTLALQTSVRSAVWPEVRDALLALPDTDPLTRQGLELLRGWDGVVGADSPAAAVFELLLAEMVARSVRAKAPRSYEWAVGKELSPLTGMNFFGYRRAGHLVRLIRRQPPGWFDRPWAEELADALATVVRRLRDGHGSDPSGWAWGRLRTLTMHHPLGRNRLLAAVFNLGPIPCGGDSDTIAQASVFPLTPLAPADNIASLRLVIDVGAWSNSRFVLPGGQSGNPCSPHYDDQFPLWRRGEGVPIPWTPEEVRAATRHTLRIEPR